MKKQPKESTATKVYQGYLTRVWYRRVLRQWAWEVCEGEARIDAGSRATIGDALEAARKAVDEIVAWESGSAGQPRGLHVTRSTPGAHNVPALADRKGVA